MVEFLLYFQAIVQYITGKITSVSSINVSLKLVLVEQRKWCAVDSWNFTQNMKLYSLKLLQRSEKTE